MGSLQDQLLKAGLTTSHQAKVAKTEKRKQQKKKKKGATSNPSDLQKVRRRNIPFNYAPTCVKNIAWVGVAPPSHFAKPIFRH